MVQTTMQTSAMTSLDNYPRRLQTLIEQLQETRRLTPQTVTQMVQAAQISAYDLMRWADFNHPIADSYGRKMVFDGGHFEVMVMSWLPGDISAIHDHGGTQWGAVQCFGYGEHYIYQLKGSTLSTLESAPYSPGMVRSVSNDLIHQMGNAGDQPFLSLHVYGNGKATGNITGNARIFDLLEGTIQYTDGGVFFCLPDSDINRRRGDIKGDRLTTRRHHEQMRDRLQRMLSHKYHEPFAQKWAVLERFLST